MNGHVNGGSAGMRDEPIYAPRRLRVVCVGAGFSGLTLAYRLKYDFNMLDYIDFCIYEANPDIGGTWYNNRYPGVACDVPAHSYTFVFEPNPDWSHFYAGGAEIWHYLRRTTTKYALDEHVSFDSRVTESVWDEATSRWTLKVQRGDALVDDVADVFINSAGFLNSWRWPDIPGLHDFAGTLMYSAQWDATVDWAGKRVALIGNGSSAIQILPHMQKTAAHLTTYIRSPTWIYPNFSSHLASEKGTNFAYSDEQKRRFREHPQELIDYRATIEHDFNSNYPLYLVDSPLQKQLRDSFTDTMRERLGGDERLVANMVPDFAVGCRRPTPGDGYLEALRADNVRVHFGGVERVTATGMVGDDGREEAFDMVVAATGFDTSYLPSWKLRGRGGADLKYEWADAPEAYLGIAVPRHPNYFMFVGPNSPVGQGSLTGCIDFTASYILRWIERMATTGIRTVEVRADATREYNDYLQTLHQRTVWNSGCRSWYKNHKKDGRVTGIYAGSVSHFQDLVAALRPEDFHVDFREGNRFRFLGNGTTAREARGEDLAGYVR